jgi:hypothetical protein
MCIFEQVFNSTTGTGGAVVQWVTGTVAGDASEHVEQYANNPIEADHSRLKHRL